VLSTFPDQHTAEQVSRALVARRLCACATLLPGARSIYNWNGALETSEEVQVFLKTTVACVTILLRELTTLHPYDLPERLVIPVHGGTDDYLQWVRQQCSIPTDLENGSFDLDPRP
jgi:periplasmic divalent cation tolerance protein